MFLENYYYGIFKNEEEVLERLKRLKKLHSVQSIITRIIINIFQEDYRMI